MRPTPPTIRSTIPRVGCLLVLAGCSTTERARLADHAVEAPPAWQAAATPGPVAGDWWQRLGSAQLTETIARTLQHNRDLHAAGARLAVAAGQAELAGVGLAPTLDYGASAVRQRTVFVGFPFGGGGPLTNTFNNYGISLNASWELDLWGSVRAGREAAAAELEASAADLRGLRQSLAGQTAKAWFAAVEARQQAALATAAVASYRTTESQIENRFRRGVRTALELRLARSQRMGAEAQVHRWDERVARALRQLEVLQGRYPGGTQTVAATLPQPGAPIPTGVPAEILRRRPDLAAAERRLAAAGFRVDQSSAALYPRLSLSGQLGTTSDSTNDLLDLDFLIWNLAANLVGPILDGGRRTTQVEIDKAREHEAIAAFAQASLRAFGEVETLLASNRHMIRQVESLAAAETEARAAETLSLDRYRNGLTEFVTVLEAQRAALTLASQVLSARRALLDLRVDLHLALGGSMQADATTDER